MPPSMPEPDPEETSTPRPGGDQPPDMPQYEPCGEAGEETYVKSQEWSSWYSRIQQG